VHPKPKNTSAIESSGPYAKPLDLDNHVPGLLVWVNNKFSADASRAYRKMFGVGLADWRIVAYLGVKEHGTAAQIGEFLGMDKAAVSRSVKFLKDIWTRKSPKGGAFLYRLQDRVLSCIMPFLMWRSCVQRRLCRGLNQRNVHSSSSCCIECTTTFPPWSKPRMR
jgi:hypothetical protein